MGHRLKKPKTAPNKIINKRLKFILQNAGKTENRSLLNNSFLLSKWENTIRM